MEDIKQIQTKQIIDHFIKNNKEKILKSGKEIYDELEENLKSQKDSKSKTNLEYLKKNKESLINERFKNTINLLENFSKYLEQSNYKIVYLEPKLKGIDLGFIATLEIENKIENKYMVKMPFQHPFVKKSMQLNPVNSLNVAQANTDFLNTFYDEETGEKNTRIKKTIIKFDEKSACSISLYNENLKTIAEYLKENNFNEVMENSPNSTEYNTFYGKYKNNYEDLAYLFCKNCEDFVKISPKPFCTLANKIYTIDDYAKSIGVIDIRYDNNIKIDENGNPVIIDADFIGNVKVKKDIIDGVINGYNEYGRKIEKYEPSTEQKMTNGYKYLKDSIYRNYSEKEGSKCNIL